MCHQSLYDKYLQISVVAADQFGEGRADGPSMPVDHQL